MSSRPAVHRPSIPKPTNRWPTAAQRGYGSAWQRARAAFLRQHSQCAACARRGRVTAATVVDHREPHKGDPVKFWDTTRWQALCKPCHDRKTATQDGGFGRTAGDGGRGGSKS
jgi:5-methylcytosine-specific restriction enzyme A